ncbi:MAG: fructose-bisphosphate aldolase [Campylobacter sp.]|nr:fructose-bisphosphate aldolase [Campylobacter sp.]
MQALKDELIKYKNLKAKVAKWRFVYKMSLSV